MPVGLVRGMHRWWGVKYLAAFALVLASGCLSGDPVVSVETTMTLDGRVAGCGELDADLVRLSFTRRSDDGRGEVHRLDIGCGEPAPNLELAPGGWTLSAELVHENHIHRHAVPQRWLLVQEGEDQVVPVVFDYGTFALDWRITVDGAPTTCAALGSDAVTVEYASHEGTRIQELPCDAGAGTSVAMPRTKAYSVYAQLSHPTLVLPSQYRTLRLVEPTGPTAVSLGFDMSAAQAGMSASAPAR